jgi:hypothetical protein
MQKVKRAYSPKERLNPGKIFPGGEKLAPAAQRQAVSHVGPDATV